MFFHVEEAGDVIQTSLVGSQSAHCEKSVLFTYRIIKIQYYSAFWCYPSSSLPYIALIKRYQNGLKLLSLKGYLEQFIAPSCFKRLHESPYKTKIVKRTAPADGELKTVFQKLTIIIYLAYVCFFGHS